MKIQSLLLPVLCSVVLSACVASDELSVITSVALRIVSNQAVTVAQCAPGDRPEAGIQGRVSRLERDNGRSTEGYNCNLVRVGQFQGEGATWVSQSYKDCAYMATAFQGILQKKLQGVQVIDVKDTANPRFVKSLDSIAFQQGTWESLKVNEPRQLLAGVAVGPINHVAFFDIYDISKDCSQPELQNGLAGPLTIPANLIGHEGGFSPDGKTYWSASANAGLFTAIDVSNPKFPKMIYTGTSGVPNHGFSFSDNGERMYLTTAAPAGVMILDVSSIQKRAAVPLAVPVGLITWMDGDISQHTIPVTFNNKPHLIVVDEFGTGAARILDISNERKPVIVSQIRLAIQMPENVDKRREDLGDNGLFGYEAHYCDVDRKVNPTALACGYFQSGVRVFDIRDPLKVREIAYYNPPAQVGKAALLPGSEHANTPGPSLSDVRNLGVGIPNANSLSPVLNTDWCSSPPRFVGQQLWVTCQDNGFMVLQFQNGVYPLE